MKRKRKLLRNIGATLVVAMLFSMGSVFAEESAYIVDESSTYVSDNINAQVEEVSYISDDGVYTTERIDKKTGERINKQVTVKLTSNAYKLAVTDAPIFDETVNVTIDALSKNISSVRVRVYKKRSTSAEKIIEEVLNNGDTCTFEIPGGYKYDVDIQVASGSVSSTNPGTVTLTVSDK